MSHGLSVELHLKCASQGAQVFGCEHHVESSERRPIHAALVPLPGMHCAVRRIRTHIACTAARTLGQRRVSAT